MALYGLIFWLRSHEMVIFLFFLGKGIDIVERWWLNGQMAYPWSYMSFS